MRSFGAVVLLLVGTFALPAAAEFPDKPIRLVVPQAAGSATDTVARILAAERAQLSGEDDEVTGERLGGLFTLHVRHARSPSDAIANAGWPSR